MERETGVEPATSTLARSRSTTELLPLGASNYKQVARLQQCTLEGAVVSLSIDWVILSLRRISREADMHLAPRIVPLRARSFRTEVL